MMLLDVRPIKTEADHAWALKEIEAYFDKEPAEGTPEAARFEVLATLVEAYEEKHYPIDAPDPIAYLKAVMAWTDRGQADLAEVLGSRSRASEVLAGKRALSKPMVIKLFESWGIPVEPLLKPYRLAAEKAKPKKAARPKASGKSTRYKTRAA